MIISSSSESLSEKSESSNSDALFWLKSAQNKARSANLYTFTSQVCFREKLEINFEPFLDTLEKESKRARSLDLILSRCSSDL